MKKIAYFFLFLLSACMSSSYMDDKTAASKAVADINASAKLNVANGIKVISLTPIKGEFVSELKKRHFLQKIRQGLVNGSYQVVSYNDSLIHEVRSLRKSKEVNQKNVPGQNLLFVADANLSGEVIELKNDYCSLTLTLTDLKTGLTLWEGNYDIQCD